MCSAIPGLLGGIAHPLLCLVVPDVPSAWIQNVRPSIRQEYSVPRTEYRPSVQPSLPASRCGRERPSCVEEDVVMPREFAELPRRPTDDASARAMNTESIAPVWSRAGDMLAVGFNLATAGGRCVSETGTRPHWFRRTWCEALSDSSAQSRPEIGFDEVAQFLVGLVGEFPCGERGLGLGGGFVLADKRASHASPRHRRKGREALATRGGCRR